MSVQQLKLTVQVQVSISTHVYPLVKLQEALLLVQVCGGYMLNAVAISSTA